MIYEGVVYRPPSERKSLIIQVTVGCSHNKCTYCNMYRNKKFKVKNLEDIYEDIKCAKDIYDSVERIFLGDANALCIETEKLIMILDKIKSLFPECKGIGIYGSPRDIYNKSAQELEKLRKYGLDIIYSGIESGSDKVLSMVNKGTSKDEIIIGGKKVIESGIKLSLIVILGLGGKRLWEDHAHETYRVLNKIQPNYLAFMTLINYLGTELNKEIESGKFLMLEPEEILIEQKLILDNLKLENCIVKSNHRSNYLNIGGKFPEDKEKIIKKITGKIMDKNDNIDSLLRLI
ncbi:MAG: radical SAM protein [Firmicutes bacterium]|jgi:radical SAM superfamily enzyme YgiQ (UPF0313 family)|nr:radical SAM protein [Bacillota bacterium]